jgi:hypothetical protein
MWRCLQEPRGENLLAQIALYLSSRPDEAARALLEQRLLSGSNDTLARLLGISAPKKQPSESEAASAPGSGPNRIAERLWSPEVAAVVQRRLPAIDRFDDGAPLVLLAGTIPNPALRIALGHTLEMHWGDGPKALESAGLAGRVIPEPGFLVVMKKLRRAEKPAKSASRSAASRNARKQDDQRASRWFALGERVTGLMCQRFREAAAAAENGVHPAAGAGRDASGDEDDKLLPPPHPGAEVLAAYRLDWPGGLDEKSTGPPLSPLRVRYMRTAQVAKPVTLLGYYRRQVPSAKQRAISGGVWLDGLSSASGDEAQDRSVDVFITAPTKSAAAPATQQQPLIVDILVVECAGHAAHNPDSESE